METKIERLDDIPVIFGVIKQMKLIETIDKYFIPHKNWKGISLGKLTAIWLCYILTTFDHRLSYLEDWAKARLIIFEKLLSEKVTNKDFSDDKLELLLDFFSDTNIWNNFEANLNSETIKVYDLQTNILRVDATIGKSFQEVVKDGLLQYGSSKHFRTDLPQFKTMLCSLDPLCLPFCSLTVSGNSADDPLYIPVIKRAINALLNPNSLFVGDCKMGSIATRAFIEKNKHHYLVPLSVVQLKDEKLKYIEDIELKAIVLQKVYRNDKVIAKGYATTKWMTNVENNNLQIWPERRFIVRSYAYAKSQIESLIKNKNKCINELQKLNEKKQGKKAFTNKQEIEDSCKRIIKQYEMESIISYTIEEDEKIIEKRGWKNHPARTEKQTNYTIKVQIDKSQLVKTKNLLGWRVYASNCLDKTFDVEKAVTVYRNEYIIEKRFNYLKNKPLNLVPLYVRKDTRITGLVNVLLLALRIISIIEYKIKENLAKEKKELEKMYPGNPNRKTKSPSIMLILMAFLDINYIEVKIPSIQDVLISVTKLNDLQKKILKLLDLSETLYTNLDTSINKNYS